MADHFTYTNSKNVTYYLNCRRQRNTTTQKVSELYYFSKEVKDRTIKADEFPDDREIKESGNGFPIVHKKKDA